MLCQCHGLTSHRMKHHPWRDLRSREDVILSWRDDLPPRVKGVTDGRDIWMSTKLIQVERRCTLTHELVHMDLGHSECQNEKVELRVRRITAAQLIDTADLIEACKWASAPEEIADELWVTLDVLEDRIRFLSPIERALIDHAIREAWHHD